MNEHPDLESLCRVMRESIPSDKVKVNAYRLLAYLASETEKQNTGSDPVSPQIDEPYAIPTKNIYIDLEGNPKQEPSSWVSNLWQQLETRFYPQIQASVIRKCAEAGWDVYPVPRKKNASPALYYVDVLPIEQLPNSEQPVESRVALPGGPVTYEEDLTLQLSRLGKIVLKGGVVWTRSKKIAAATWFSVSLVLMLGPVLTMWFALSASTTPLSARDLMMVATLFGVPWVVLRQMDRSTRVFEDRIVLAPAWALGWKEFGATLELEGEPGDEEPRVFRVARYTATCSICEGLVLLSDGEPDFPRRIVGRCSRSPREHVFTFDRVTKQGTSLYGRAKD